MTASVARETLARTEVLYPERYGEPIEDEQASDLLASWRREPPGRVQAPHPGYVQRAGIDDLAKGVGARDGRMAVLVCPGDFVGLDAPIAEVWPAAAAETCRGEILGAVSIASERDLNQDVDFGIRQLTDIALKAVSPGVNDPATAVTCIGYLGAILSALTGRAAPPGVRRFPDGELTVIVRQRQFEEYLESMLQINRYAGGDAWVIGTMLETLGACARTALRYDAHERVHAIRGVADTIAEQAAGELTNERDRARIDGLMAQIQGG